MGDSVAISDCSTSQRSDGVARDLAQRREEPVRVLARAAGGSRARPSPPPGMTLIFSLPDRPVTEIVVRR